MATEDQSPSPLVFAVTPHASTEAWTGIATADGVHPTDAGYVTLANYCITAYAPHV